MQEASVHFSTSGHMTDNKAVPETSPVKSLQCTRCTIIFKSRVYLFEHLNIVHSLDVDTALKEAGLKHHETVTVCTGNKRINLGNVQCQHCGFKACSQENLTEHEMKCKKISGNQNGIVNPAFPENQETEIIVISTEQHKEGAGAKESLSNKSTNHKSKCPVNSSKDLKTYKRPLQTITKYFSPSAPQGKPSLKLSENPRPVESREMQETLILKESPSCSSPESSGVFKVTAKSMIDISKQGSHRFLLDDHFVISDLTSSPEPVPEQVTKNPPNKWGKRRNDEQFGSAAKKAKFSQKPKMPPEEVKEKEHQSSSNADFLFEISEDEEEKMANLLNEDTENPKRYFCKQCNYSDMGTKAISIHYRNHHPYVKYNVPYIKDQRDQSATFRCLECPVEFLNVADLKRHYAENHPEAASVFSKQLFELKLVFKCFVCSFTSNVLNLLKRHYKENHPTHKVNNSLLYYRYSVAQEEEVKNAQSPQHPTSKGSDTVLYHCNNCQFSHKSAVVMHVHYQKSHPHEEVTIDKIKQSVNVTSQITPKKSVTVTENNTPQNNILDSSEKAKLQRKLSLSLKRKCTPDASNTESSKSEKVKTAKEGSKTKTTKSNKKTPAATDNSFSSSPDKLFYCQFCSYSSTNVKSVAGHHKVKHAEHGLRDTEDILRYSADMWKKQQSKTEASEEDNVGDASVTMSNRYACAENLFYCQKCNFGNPTLKGVVNHQNKAHHRINTNLETILEHTASIRDEIKKSKTEKCASSTNLPLPILNKGDENLQFCPMCNYRHNSMDRMLKHCFQAHRAAQVKTHQIQKYTLEVLKQAQNSLLQTTASQAAKSASLVGKVKKKKTTTKILSKGLPVSASPSMRATKTRGDFKCHRCKFRAQCLSVLRRHMWKSHKSNRSVHEILQVLYKHESIESGYHCDTCVFSDEAATVVQKHFNEQHPERKMTFEYILRRLYVGPKKDPPEDKNAKITHIDAISDGACTDGSLPSQRSGQNETKRHSCRACPFRGSSMSSLANHYRAVHPWTVKDDGSVLNVITSAKLSENSDVEEDHEMQGTIVTQEVPPGSGTESPSSVKCRYCPAIFNTPHGLQTHYGMKHLDVWSKSSAKQAVQTQTRVHVFNCPHCTYINTNYHGVLTHCQMKHPTLPSSVDSTHVDGKLVPKDKDGKSLKFKGYMCGSCPQIHATLEKFNKHCEKDHNDTVQNALKPALKPLTIKNLQQSNNHSSQGSVSKASFLSKKKFARIKCQQCSYTCTNKLALSHHVQLQHRNASNAALKVRGHEYKCNLCFSPYFSEKYLENHYIRKHGKDAYLKYRAEVGKHVPEQPDPNTLMGEERVMVFKCPRCPYVNACTHGILTHCQMRHPSVVARADELKRDEIVVSKMVGCNKGKSSNERGYKCKKCSQVYATLMKLKVHQEKKHKQADQEASERLTDTKIQPHFDSDYSVLEALAIKNQSDSLGTATAEETTNADLSQQPTSPEERQVSLENEKSQYKCTMCSYVGICRKYLQCHYKNSHKLDPLTTYKLLVKYTKRKTSYLHKAMLKESAQVKCKKCPDLMFDSSQLLIAHYSVFHYKMDFTVLSEPSKNYGGVYRCAHCRKKIRGIGKLWHHLDCHAAKEKKKAKAANAPPVITTTPEATSLEPGLEEEPPTLETVEELAPLSVTPEQSFDFPTRQDKHRCKPCGRNFNSLKGLRLHERSHAALAAIKKLNHLPTSVQKQSIDKYLLYKSGTLRPFVCVICSFRTTVLDLWRTHFTKKHQDVIADSAETDNQDKEEAHTTRMEPPNLSEDHNYLAEPKEEPDVADESLYLEPPDVQRQLNNYNLVAQTSNRQQTAMVENSLLHCESCTFSTGHISSLRRHYANRHGKKILKCRDCDFFTSSRKILDMHVEMGHSTFQAQATQQRFLRCPFCLYQTRTKNSMIDHIVLHRDERLVPIEVRRSKLSRYLHGVVFRCHKCTFTSGSAENLRLHMIKHDDIKPYKCRLCYFDCALLSDLEAHLSDKHQVMRNHELVGQVSLDKLELVSGGMMTKEEEVVQEETSSNFEPHNNDSEDVETEEFGTDRNEINRETQAENLAESHIEETTTVQMKESSQDLQGQAGSADLSDNASGRRMEVKVEPDAESSNVADIRSDEGSSRERDGNQAQPQERHCEDSGVSSPQQKEEEAEGSSTACGKINVRMEAHELNEEELQQRTLNIEERVENDILRHILLLDKDEDDELPKADQDRAIKTEESTMSDCGDDTLHESPDEGGSIAASRNSKLEVDPESKRNHAHANNERFKVDRHLLTLSPSRVQLMISHNIKSSKNVSLTNCKEEHVHIQTHSEEMTDPYGEMPVLENEYLKDHPTPLGSCKEEEDEMVTEDSEDRCKDQEHEEEEEISAHKSSDTATNEAAEVLCPTVTEIKLYTCELCGRNLKDSSELTRHVMRHGL